MIGIILQTRMSSSRLPGKVLMPVSGRPMLWYLVASLRNSPHPLVVATSDLASDDPIAAFCEANSVAVYRGPLDDVAGRLLATAKAHGMEAFARVCGDSPLIDYRIIDQAINLYKEGGYDLVTNVHKRTFPKGQSVEVVRTSVMEKVVRLMTTPAEREHVTKFFYASPEQFCIHNFESGLEGGGYNFCVDTEEDMSRIKRVFKRMERPHWEYTWRESLKLMQKDNPNA